MSRASQAGFVPCCLTVFKGDSAMQRLTRMELHIRVIFAGTLFVLIALLIPLFIIGHYNFASVDDIGYAKTAEAVWDETHSVIRTCLRQVSYAWDYWHTWQGTFAAEWFTTTAMGFFGRNAYYVGTYLSLGGFVLFELLLFMVILKKVMGADFFRAGIVSACVVSLQVLLTPVPVEAFFWFCGSALYTVTYNETAVLVTLLVLLYHCSASSGRWKRILLYTGIVLFTVLVSGGTYVTLVLMLLLYLFAVIWYWYRRNPGRWFVTAGMVLYLAGFLLNVLAPGNRARLSTAGAEGSSAVMAILLALKEAAFYVAGNAILPCMVLGVLFLPLFANIVKKKDYKYPFPFLVTMISFGVFAAQFTPTLYTLGITGAGRIQNLYRWTFYIWLYGNELYWVGWLYRRKLLSPGSAEDGQAQRSYLLGGWTAGGLALCFTLYVWGGSTLTSLSAVDSLRRGQAQTYYKEHQERLAVLEDESIKVVRFEPFSCAPYLLFFGDITEDPEDWVNDAMSSYYGKDSVALVGEK